MVAGLNFEENTRFNNKHSAGWSGQDRNEPEIPEKVPGKEKIERTKTNERGHKDNCM